ncbi:MAG: hypothetical protein DHS20C21_23870 [Gemmatimonadota bacterium]|nr:MAG: hypothetical protein DHS20C21_23870 [Gemmatimonadota bacterium]
MRELDSVDLLGATTWSRPVGCGRWVPFAGVLGGIRREWLGSFRESRFPVGGVVGVRAVAGPHSAFRAEYQHLRILGDPSGDRSEHQVLFGLSLLLRND